MIVVLLLWATRLMLHAETADDVAAELPSEEELEVGAPSDGVHAAQPDEDEPSSPAR